MKGIDTDYNTHLAHESNRETDKANSFADDNSTATLAEVGSLESLKTIVNNFASFSGLSSNPEKTTLLLIGRTDNFNPELLRLGFNIVNEVNLLGMKIDNNLSVLTEYFEDVITKVIRIKEFWERFHLSLPGRISVCKTFMLSQIGYLGCILTPTKNQLKRLQECLDQFCLGTMNLAKKRLYWPASEGGMGLIDLEKFITALQCAWIKRTNQHWCDNWRYDIKKACYGNPCIINEGMFNANCSPILTNLAKSFTTFRTEFLKKDMNYRKAFVFNNPSFKRGRNDPGILCEQFFGHNTAFETRTKLAKLKFEDFFERGGPKSLENLNREYELNFSLVIYMRLHAALQFFV